MNTFLPKRETQQVTYFDRRMDRWNSDNVDRLYHKQLDFFLASRASKGVVLDIRSKKDCRIGCTTHHLQVASLRLPIRKREKRGSPGAPLPWDIWKNNDIVNQAKKAVPRIFNEPCPDLQIPLRQIETLIHFDTINNDMYTNPLIIYFDGAFLQQKGGWAFLAVTWDGQIIFERWCAVCLNKQKDDFLGAHSLSNNTAELSAFGEALIWLLCECVFPWRERGVVFAYDSTYAVGAGSGEWRSLENSALVTCVSSLWMFRTIEKFKNVYGYKIKSHVQNEYNERVDTKAKWGAGVPVDGVLEVCQTPRVISTTAAVSVADRLYREHSDTFGRPIDTRAFGSQNADDVYAKMLEATNAITDFLREAAPKKPPLRPYIATECLQLLEERDECWRNNSKQRYTELGLFGEPLLSRNANMSKRRSPNLIGRA